MELNINTLKSSLEVLISLIDNEEIRFDTISVSSKWNLENVPEIASLINQSADRMESLSFRENIRGYEWGSRFAKKPISHIEERAAIVTIAFSNLDNTRKAFELYHGGNLEGEALVSALEKLGFTPAQLEHIKVGPAEKPKLEDDGFGGKIPSTTEMEPNEYAGIVDVSNAVKQTMSSTIRGNRRASKGTDGFNRYLIASKAKAVIDQAKSEQFEAAGIDIDKLNAQREERRQANLLESIS